MRNPDTNRAPFRVAAVVFGELLILLGVVAGSFVAYQLIGSNIVSSIEGQRVADELVRSWETVDDQELPELEQQSNDALGSLEQSSEARPLAAGQTETEALDAFGLVYIPRLKSDVWGIPLMEDVSDRSLALGIGHYSSTALPGELGNFAIAGHRATFGEPFAQIERLRPGDEVIIRTESSWHVYHLVTDRIVQPNENWVLSAVPVIPELSGTPSVLTITTCEPRFNSTERWIWFGELIESRAVFSTPESIKGGS